MTEVILRARGRGPENHLAELQVTCTGGSTGPEETNFSGDIGAQSS